MPKILNGVLKSILVHNCVFSLKFFFTWFVVPAEEIVTGIPPYFDKKPKFQNVETGATVKFDAVVRALPQPDVSIPNGVNVFV